MRSLLSIPSRPERTTENAQSTARIEALTDGIFAVAMTLLVLALQVARGGAADSNAGVFSVFSSAHVGSKFLWFLASFTVAAFYWNGHHMIFWSIERANRILKWINLAFLVPVVLVPFTTQLVGEFPHAPAAATLYVLDVLAAGLILDACWFYAMLAGLLSPELSPEIVRAINVRVSVVSVILIAAACISPFIPHLAIGVMLAAMLSYVIVTAGMRLLVD
jgi:uncharacterized membrane protein